MRRLNKISLCRNKALLFILFATMFSLESLLFAIEGGPYGVNENGLLMPVPVRHGLMQAPQPIHLTNTASFSETKAVWPAISVNQFRVKRPDDPDYLTDQTAGSTPSFQIWVLPIAYLDYDRGRKIVNLGEDQESCRLSKSFPQPSQLYASWCEAIYSSLMPADQENDFYRVIDNKKLIGGLGAFASMSLSDPASAASLGGVAAGILPLAGKTIHSKRIVRSYQVAIDLPSPKIPRTAEELETWNTGDLLSYTAEGGIAVFAAYQYYGNGVAFPLVIEGEWGISIQKEPNNKFIFEIIRKKIFNISAILGNVLTHVSLEASKYINDSYVFEVDLNYEEARLHYKDLIRGRLSQMQELAADKSVAFIKPLSNTHSNTTSTAAKATLGFPVLIKSVRAKQHEKSKINKYDFDTDETMEAYVHSVDKHHLFQRIHNLFSKKNKHKPFNHVNKYQKTTAEVIKIQGNGPQAESANYSEILWSYSNDAAEIKHLEKALKKLYKFTGLKPQLAVNWKGEEKLGYLSIFFKIIFSHEGLNNLQATLRRSPDSLVATGEGLASDYFTSQGDPSGLCRKKDSSEISQSCMQKYRKKTIKILTKVQDQILKGLTNPKSDASLAKELAEIGAQLTKSPFAIQSLISLSPQSFHASYLIEGEKFRPHERLITIK